MDDALGIDHDFDLRRRHAEQVGGFDHLQGLVHHGRRINRDLAAHHPIGMGAGLVGRDQVQGVHGTLTERPTGGRQDDLLDAAGPGGRVFRQRLENGGVLAVDGKQLCTTLAHRVQEHRAAHHQGFLVGQQQALARAGRCHAGGQAGGPDDGCHHHIDLRV